MYNTASDMIESCARLNIRLSELVLQNEARSSELSRQEIRRRMGERLDVMITAAHQALKEDVRSRSGLTGGDAKRIENARASGSLLCGDVVGRAMALALSCSEVNASMGIIVAAPTAGSCGIIPGALLAAASADTGADRERLIDALLTASGVGQIISKNATVSGAEGGCQAECGSAAAMAAAGVVELRGGTPEQSFDAAAMALKNVLGLVCDPVAGLVEVPCAKRNVSGAVNALICADMALAGVHSVIPFDEVVEAMYRVGRALPREFRETALGGLAATPTARRIEKCVLSGGRWCDGDCCR